MNGPDYLAGQAAYRAQANGRGSARLDGGGIPPKPADRRVRRDNGTDNRVPPPIHFKVTSFGDIRPEDGAQYLIKGLLPRVGLAVIWGEPKCGKSFWTFDALMHVALDLEYRGHRVKPGAVVYCALEGAQGFKNRIEAFRQRKLSESAASSPPFYLMSASLSLVAQHNALIADMRKQLDGQMPVAICLDTLNRSLVGSESSDEDMAAYIRAADAIREAFDCLVVIIHHCGHNGDRPRGHSSLMGALDVQIAVRRDAAENVVAELELAKDGEVGLQFVSRLEVVEIGRDQDGDPISSCVIEEVEGASPTAAKSKGGSLPKAAQIALRALSTAIDALGEVPPPSNHLPPGVRVVTIEQWRAYAYQSGISGAETPDAKRMAFNRAHDALVAGKHAAAWGEYRWPTK